MKFDSLIENKNLKELIQEYPYIKDFFKTYSLPLDSNLDTNFDEYFKNLSYRFIEDIGTDKKEMTENFISFMQQMEKIKKDNKFMIHDITIIGGKDKINNSENVELTLKKGDIVCLVGPTGSGKSRLLADIEWLAQGDTVTKRHILINKTIPPKSWKFSIEDKIVAQLSQNMNFVMDISVEDFIRIHAESRMTQNIDEKIKAIIKNANDLSGEPFDLKTPLTSLSGGQSRALMVTDTAYLSKSPIVLIDEIENAGIDKQKALKLLVKKDKIVLIATHDPVMALMGNKRIVLKNGGIYKIIETSEKEKENLKKLEYFDKQLKSYRETLRSGKMLEKINL
jgi:ABC-type lipoprotein export system ATPase subunit